jgi:hypothetical protein
VRRIAELLQKTGCTITSPKTVRGVSGPQTFDISVQRENEEIVFDIESEHTEVGPEIIAAFYAKILDTRPRRAILICIPNLNRDARSLSIMYKLETVIASDIREAETKVSELIEADKLL